MPAMASLELIPGTWWINCPEINDFSSCALVKILWKILGSACTGDAINGRNSHGEHWRARSQSELYLEEWRGRRWVEQIKPKLDCISRDSLSDARAHRWVLRRPMWDYLCGTILFCSCPPFLSGFGFENIYIWLRSGKVLSIDTLLCLFTLDLPCSYC